MILTLFGTAFLTIASFLSKLYDITFLSKVLSIPHETVPTLAENPTWEYASSFGLSVPLPSLDSLDTGRSSREEGPAVEEGIDQVAEGFQGALFGSWFPSHFVCVYGPPDFNTSRGMSRGFLCAPNDALDKAGTEKAFEDMHIKFSLPTIATDAPEASLPPPPLPTSLSPPLTDLALYIPRTISFGFFDMLDHVTDVLVFIVFIVSQLQFLSWLCIRSAVLASGLELHEAPSLRTVWVEELKRYRAFVLAILGTRGGEMQAGTTDVVAVLRVAMMKRTAKKLQVRLRRAVRGLIPDYMRADRRDTDTLPADERAPSMTLPLYDNKLNSEPKAESGSSTSVSPEISSVRARTPSSGPPRQGPASERPDEGFKGVDEEQVKTAATDGSTTTSFAEQSFERGRRVRQWSITLSHASTSSTDESGSAYIDHLWRFGIPPSEGRKADVSVTTSSRGVDVADMPEEQGDTEESATLSVDEDSGTIVDEVDEAAEMAHASDFDDPGHSSGALDAIEEEDEVFGEILSDDEELVISCTCHSISTVPDEESVAREYPSPIGAQEGVAAEICADEEDPLKSTNPGERSFAQKTPIQDYGLPPSRSPSPDTSLLCSRRPTSEERYP